MNEVFTDHYFSESFNKTIKEIFEVGNIEKIDILVFPDGTVITTPIIKENKKCINCKKEMKLDKDEFWVPTCKCYPDDLRILTLKDNELSCMKCNTVQKLSKVFIKAATDTKKEEWCYWCPNCKDRISPYAVREI